MKKRFVGAMVLASMLSVGSMYSVLGADSPGSDWDSLPNGTDVEEYKSSYNKVIVESTDPVVGNLFYNSQNGLMVGRENQEMESKNVLVMGNGNIIQKNKDSSQAGHDNTITEGTGIFTMGNKNEFTGSDNTVNVGTENTFYGSTGSTSIGNNNTNSLMSNSVNIGNKNENENGSSAVVIGTGNKTDMLTNSIVIGSDNKLPKSSGQNNIIIGNEVTVKDKIQDSIGLGKDTLISKDRELSIGNEKLLRTITHVESGKNDTDAVNVSQLKTKANTNLDNLTDDGKKFIFNTAKRSVNVNGSTYIDVKKTSMSIDGEIGAAVDTYTISVSPDAIEGIVDRRVEDVNKKVDFIVNVMPEAMTKESTRIVKEEISKLPKQEPQTEVEVKAGNKVEVTTEEDAINHKRTYTINMLEDRSQADELKKVETKFHTMEQNMEQRFSTLDKDIAESGAMSAALAALKPTMFTGKEPWSVMAGVGNYRNKTAVALGLAHYDGPTKMYHMGCAFDHHRSMFNAGVSLAFGSGAEYITQEEAKSLRAKIAEQDLQIKAMMQMIKELQMQVNKK